MDNEARKLSRSIEILKAIADGVNPFTNDCLEDNTIFNDARMVRCLYYVIEVLEKVNRGEIGQQVFRKDLPFMITPEEKSKIVLPEENIGVNAFAKCVNQVINPNRSKKLTGTVLNNQLKKMGILSEEKTSEGKTQTVTNVNSSQYGIETMKIDYNGATYDKVVFNEKGKRFLIEHLEEIMSYQ